MKAILLLFLVVYSLKGITQDKLTVKYNAQYLSLTNMLDKDGNAVYKWISSPYQYQLNVVDKLAAFSYASTAQGALTYTNVASRHIYTPVSAITERPLMVEDSILNLDWKFTGLIDTICGFSCRLAVASVSHRTRHALRSACSSLYFDAR